MLKQTLIDLISMLLVSGVTALLLAYPVKLILNRQFGRKAGFWKSYLLTLVIDMIGHMARGIIFMIIGGYAPPLTGQWTSWIGNALWLLAAGWLVLRWRMKHENGGRPSTKPLLISSAWIGALLLARDGVLALILFQQLRQYM